MKKRARPTHTGPPMGRGSLIASAIFRPPGFSTRFSRDGAVMMISGTAGLLNDEGGDDEDDDESVLRDSTVEIKKQKHDVSGSDINAHTFFI